MERHLRILHAVAEVVSRSLDVDEVLRTAVGALTHITGHEIASLHLLASNGSGLHLRGDRGLSAHLREVNLVLPVAEGIISRVVARGKTYVTRNVVRSPYLYQPARDAVRRDRIRGFVCVPIHSRGRILGALSLGRRTPRPFTTREVILLEATADQIGIALDNARLYSETVRRLEDLKRAQAQLVHAEKLAAIGELASGIAHEINNPLTAILGLAQLGRDHAGIDSYLSERLAVIVREATRAARIVQNLLLFGRHYPPERRPCSLAEQVRRVLELKAHQLQQDRIRVVTEFAACESVWADENQMQQVILNIVQNAHQAMAGQPGDRALTVRVGMRDARAFVDVLDSGPGIPAEAMPRIFDPFFTTKPPHEGSGLGLSVSYGIVAEHAGTLRAENRAEGGARFVIELPLDDPTARATSSAAASSSQA